MVNALLNAASAAQLLLARRAIRLRREAAHKKLMLGALGTSAVFLLSYLARVAMTGTHRDPHEGLVHFAYLAILGSHMVLAMLVPPLAIFAVLHGLRDARAKHRRVVKYAYPIWLYVSVTGVLVYLILYHLPA